MFTIVPSSTSISWATAATTRTSQRRSAGAVRRSRVAEDVVPDDIKVHTPAWLGRELAPAWPADTDVLVPPDGQTIGPSQVKSHHRILVIRAPTAVGALV
jgi:hypothetical protein